MTRGDPTVCRRRDPESLLSKRLTKIPPTKLPHPALRVEKNLKVRESKKGVCENE